MALCGGGLRDARICEYCGGSSSKLYVFRFGNDMSSTAGETCMSCCEIGNGILGQGHEGLHIRLLHDGTVACMPT